MSWASEKTPERQTRSIKQKAAQDQHTYDSGFPPEVEVHFQQIPEHFV